MLLASDRCPRTTDTGGGGLRWKTAVPAGAQGESFNLSHVAIEKARTLEIARQFGSRPDHAPLSALPRCERQGDVVIVPAILERVDARLSHLEQHSRGVLHCVRKQVATSPTRQVHCKRIPVFADEPVLVTNLDPSVVKNAAVPVHFDGIFLFIDHGNDRALSGRQVPAFENHRSFLSPFCHHTRGPRVARLDARYRDHVPLAGELSLPRHQAVDHWRDTKESRSITITIIQLNDDRQLLRLLTIAARLCGVSLESL